MSKRHSPKPASIRDVAACAGVSVATVSNVLRNRKPVTTELASRVHEAVAALDYRTDRAAAQLRTGKASVVAILAPSLENPFFTAVIAAFERHARDAGYDIIIASAGDNDEAEAARLSALLAWRPAGIAILPCTDRFLGREVLNRSNIPYVLLDRLASQPESDLITADNEKGGSLAAEHLLFLGHERILVVATTLSLANIRERRDAIYETCRRNGSAEPELIEAGWTFTSVNKALNSWLGEHERPSAIIALTNFATLGVLAALREAGLVIPDDVSLVGFDDYAWMYATSPAITAVRQPVEALGAHAWASLMRRIDGDDSPFSVIRLPCDLQIRQSTSPYAKTRKTS